MRTKIQKWGNSLGLRIPKSFAEEAQIHAGSTVDLSMDDGRLVVRRLRVPPYRLEDLLSKVTKDNLHEEVPTGGAVGREAW
jgi:antitoxin MazE